MQANVLEKPQVVNGHSHLKEVPEKRAYNKKPMKIVPHEHPESQELEKKPKNDLLYFNDAQVDRMVKLTEDQLRNEMQLLNAKEAPFREVEAMYLEEKKHYDKAVQDVENSKQMLGQLSKYRERLKPNAEIRILRKTSHAEKKRKVNGNKNKSIKWTELGVIQLTKMNRFLDPVRLWDIVLQENPEVTKELNDTNRLAKARHSTLLNWKLTAQKTDRKHGKNLMVMFNEKLGLPEWLNEERQPVGNYLKEFMFNNSGD